MITKIAIIVAGGNGQRMQAETPKQFLCIHNKPIIIHTLEAFIKAVNDIELILVLPKDSVETWEKIKVDFNFRHPVNVIKGGKTRTDSVINGLNAVVDHNSIIAIHDGVRPLVSADLIKQGFDIAEESGNAIPVLPINESLRFIDNQESHPVSRNGIYSVQTPQCFQYQIIADSYEGCKNTSFTDDATVAESAGYSLNFYSGETTNIKITFPNDLKTAEFYLKMRS